MSRPEPVRRDSMGEIIKLTLSLMSPLCASTEHCLRGTFEYDASHPTAPSMHAFPWAVLLGENLSFVADLCVCACLSLCVCVQFITEKGEGQREGVLNGFSKLF